MNRILYLKEREILEEQIRKGSEDSRPFSIEEEEQCLYLSNMTASAGSDSFRLKWDDFQENLVNHLKGSKGDADFSDVTLVCEDGRQFEAHRMILAAGSGFFSAVLREGFKINVVLLNKACLLNPDPI